MSENSSGERMQVIRSHEQTFASGQLYLLGRQPSEVRVEQIGTDRKLTYGEIGNEKTILLKGWGTEASSVNRKIENAGREMSRNAIALSVSGGGEVMVASLGSNPILVADKSALSGAMVDDKFNRNYLLSGGDVIKFDNPSNMVILFPDGTKMGVFETSVGSGSAEVKFKVEDEKINDFAIHLASAKPFGVASRK